MSPRRMALGVSLLVTVGCGEASVARNAAPQRVVSADLSTTAAPATPASPGRTVAHAAKLVLTGRVIVVDPGHNGGNSSHPEIINRLVDAGRGRRKPCNTTGTATARGYTESAFNLSVGLALRRLLRAAGARVVMTRTDDRGAGPCVNKRAEIGNRAHADAVVAIHADGGPSSGHGFHVIYPPDAGDTAPIYRDSLRLARDVHDAIIAARLLPTSSYAGRNGYDERDDLAGLNLSKRPAIFVELGNMDNRGDAALQTNPRFRAAVARALADGLRRYLTRS